MNTINIENKNAPLQSTLQAKVCDRFFSRLRGLMFRHDLGQAEGLLLVQTRESRIDASIHMFFVYMDLAVIWIDSGEKCGGHSPGPLMETCLCTPQTG